MRGFLFILCSIISIASPGQVINGSFEQDTLPDLSGWEWTCGAASFKSAPAAGGDWCIKVAGGNVKGCFPGYAYQKIPSITDGRSYTLSGWAFSEIPSPVGIYFGTINQGTILLQAGDTTSSMSWTSLSIQSNFTLANGDTAVVVLFGGIAAGPVQGYGYFDLINLEEVTGLYPPEQGVSLIAYPNPFTETTNIQFGKVVTNATISVYNIYGQLVEHTILNSGDSYSFHRGDLPNGLYFLQVVGDDKLTGVSKIEISDF